MLALASEDPSPFGIETCAIMPGDIARASPPRAPKNPTGGDGDVYRGRIARSVAVMEHDEMNGIPASAAGAFVAKKALQRRVPPLCTLGGKYKVFVFLTRLLPTRLMTDIVGKIYAS